METIIKHIPGGAGDEEIFAQAGDILRRGGLVAFPTETVYGLGADALNPAACKKIYAAKGRPSDNPLIVHVSDKLKVREIAEADARAEKLMKTFWPGPLTLVMKKKYNVPDEITGGLDTVAVRCPDHKTARRLLEVSGLFIAAPSANLSGRPSPTLAQHVIEDMDGRIDMIIADDSVSVGIESTILDISSETPVILRPGVVTGKEIEEVLGADVTFTQTNSEAEGVPKAPGMKYRHYAPQAELFLVRGENDAVVAEIRERAKSDLESGKKVFIITTEENVSRYEASGLNVISLGSRDDAAGIARDLFAALRRCDKEGAEVIFAESLDESGAGAAVMNRLLKAAGHNIIEK